MSMSDVQIYTFNHLDIYSLNAWALNWSHMLWKYKIGSNIICEGQLYELILGIKEDFLLFCFFFFAFQFWDHFPNAYFRWSFCHLLINWHINKRIPTTATTPKLLSLQLKSHHIQSVQDPIFLLLNKCLTTSENLIKSETRKKQTEVRRKPVTYEQSWIAALIQIPNCNWKRVRFRYST